ncbi:divalent metal cation (Fe/Co/Zn/Cd) transporter [Mycolicibacterium sp. BK556]|uniref:cation transporter n=1 Tax=unclassified Mycolicibacterium TaxID=2636767 RepID=UPI0016098EA2|nr:MULTISPECIES: cation transporter [unclassified Mycolicibacterium]MBB3602494.1 divalent metal cation (Fe/Co/Zn/Cd) transporter [Mycolicibacterium sp. BK556]MBB3632246.1 divalent metal cation (Fe/Co/Zn/Cd) transporter [Mycolicibacterium sp. BK607]
MTDAAESMVLRAERRSLHVYMFTMLGLAVVGFAVYAITRVSATQLDGVISLINAAAAFIAARLAVTSSRPPDAESPYGRLALENLYALFRSLMILGVVIVGVVTNTVKVIEYLVTRQGTEPEFGLAAVYTAGCVLICFALKWNHERNNRSVNGASALLRVEATAAKMEAFISGGICASLVLVAVLPDGTFLTSSTFNIKDIADSIIVLILCVLLVGQPVRQIRLEIGRLSGRRADPALDEAVRAAIAAVSAEHADELDHELTLVDALAISRGKTTEVDLRVSYTGVMSVDEQDELRARTFEELRNRIGPIRLTLVFSALPIHAAL